MKKIYEKIAFEFLRLTDSYVLLQASGEGTGGGVLEDEDKDGFEDDFIV